MIDKSQLTSRQSKVKSYVTYVRFKLVCPKPSIDYPGTRVPGYPGTRVFEGFSEHSGTRVVGSSTRVFNLKVVFYIYSTFSIVLKV